MKDVPLCPLFLDGATGTELMKRGMPEGACTEQWVLRHPDRLLELQRAYVDAGCRVLTAPTLGGSPAALARFGLEGATEDYNRRLVALTRQAAGGKALVAGDLGPCAFSQAPVRESKFEALIENYKVQVRALKAAGVDLYLIETMLTMAEARAALLAVKEADGEKPALVSFHCDEDGRTPDGTDVLGALIVMQGMGAASFGLNCAAPEVLAEQLERLVSYSAVPLLAMPNGDGGDLAPWAERFAALGVRCFGGCCGTGPDDMRELYKAVKELHLTAFTPREQDPDVIPCASEKEARFITPDVDVGETLECGPDLLEDILEAEEQRPQGALKIAILEEDDVALFAENQYAVRDALCLWSDVPELLEQALRTYQGRAFWDNTAELDKMFLQEMARKYGMVVL